MATEALKFKCQLDSNPIKKKNPNHIRDPGWIKLN